jgi:S-adenosylmethionine synthetase
MTHFFTSESVSEGHPDKLADQVSDAVLDAVLAQDPMGRVACEVLLKGNMAVVAGELTTTARVNFENIVRMAYRNAGYVSADIGTSADQVVVLTQMSEQSPEIAQGVDEQAGLHQEQGAGDQGLMFGFACNETPECMPLPISLSHKILHKVSNARRSGKVSFLRPDAKSQVTIEYDGHTPLRVDTIVVSTQHAPNVSHKTLEEFIRSEIVPEVIPPQLLDAKTKYLINPTGSFIIGGPIADAGLTGRKIIVDTYGGYSRHGGGAFSGKDPTKVDRSAAYGARYVAKNIILAGLAERCEIQVSYAIGVAEPVSLLIECFGTERVPPVEIEKAIRKNFSFSPKGIIETLALRKPIYYPSASYGHFGREAGPNGEFSWERGELAIKLRKELGV